MRLGLQMYVQTTTCGRRLKAFEWVRAEEHRAGRPITVISILRYRRPCCKDRVHTPRRQEVTTVVAFLGSATQNDLVSSNLELMKSGCFNYRFACYSRQIFLSSHAEQLF